MIIAILHQWLAGDFHETAIVRQGAGSSVLEASGYPRWVVQVTAATDGFLLVAVRKFAPASLGAPPPLRRENI